MSDDELERKRYAKDTRIACKYGIKCYQKNPDHLKKYKHPPKKQTEGRIRHAVKKLKIERPNKDLKEIITKNEVSDSDEYNIEDDSDFDSDQESKKPSINNDVSDSDETDIENDKNNVGNIKNEESKKSGNTNSKRGGEMLAKLSPKGSDKGGKDDDASRPSISNYVSDSDETDIENDKNNPSNVKNEESKENTTDLKKRDETIIKLDPKEFIKQKFLVDMPDDFYQFWDFCKKMKSNNPSEALRDIGLTLVGPFDVLAGKFDNIKKPDEAYLLHWRYYFDPPEFQTVLKGDDKTGYHIGYFRDSPESLPVFLASNSAKKDGILHQMGGNIFTAVTMYLDDLKKFGDPFKKMHIGRIQAAVQKEAERLKLNLSRKTDEMVNREKQILTRTFNKIGLVVPYNRSNQLGYRQLSFKNSELAALLTKLQKALPEQKSKYLSELQPLFTNTNIATDECDFGTGIELGLNILSHGIDSLNSTVQSFLTNNYRLINREAFAKITEAHMKNRKKGCDLSIL